MINDVLPPKAPQNQNETPKEPADPDFKTPEQVAVNDSFVVNVMGKPGKVQSINQKEGRTHVKIDLRNRREQVLLVIILLVIGVVGVVGWKMTHPHKTAVVATKKVVVQKKVVVPVTVPSTLTGLPVNPSVNQQPVTGVMIENSTFARPQSGLSQAGVVFEAIAEGGITRFLALFQDTAPDNVGPIRSVRPYYAQWVLGFNGSLAHVGGSPEALANIKAWGVRDLDQFANGGSYHRVTTREAPHNVYTGIPTLNQLEVQKGFSTSTYTGFARKKAAPAKVPTARTINLTISGPDYNVVYTYDTVTNTYKRNVGGAPHMDANTNTQLSPNVVIALVIPYSIESDGYHSNYATIGSGPVFIFQDGIVATGTWTKSANDKQFTFADASGNELKLNPGQTWLSAVKLSSNVTYAP